MGAKASAKLRSKDVAIVWLRQDLRVSDQPALAAAAAQHDCIVPVYIWSPDEDGIWAPGSASKWWLHHSLESLDFSLKKLGSGLVLRKGPTIKALEEVISETGARYVYWNARYEPTAVEHDHRVRASLEKSGVRFLAFNGSLLQDPDSILNGSGNPYLVFGAFWKKMSKMSVGDAIAAPKKLPPIGQVLASTELSRFGLMPKISWDDGLKKIWNPGEKSALSTLNGFCKAEIAAYSLNRDIPGLDGTSRLSPHLHFGELSPRQAWLCTQQSKSPSAVIYRKELAWREFSYYLLHHHPRLSNEPLREEFKKFPWERNTGFLKAWQRGATGYPIVDAGMRELWHTGWMHNRVRMIVASFLVKDLRIHWLEGARWFWDTLLDADLANNTQGWQWTSGCGADAAPYFRVFNPVLQGKKFDPRGDYVRRWVPEIGHLPNAKIHTPWEAGQKLKYPDRIVDHDRARFSALRAFDMIKKKS